VAANGMKLVPMKPTCNPGPTDPCAQPIGGSCTRPWPMALCYISAPTVQAVVTGTAWLRQFEYFFAPPTDPGRVQVQVQV
jgi:hypothetical protein